MRPSTYPPKVNIHSRGNYCAHGSPLGTSLWYTIKQIPEINVYYLEKTFMNIVEVAGE